MFDINADLTPILKLNTGCDYHRVILPLQYMGFDTDRLQDENETLEKRLSHTKIFFFNRTTSNNFYDILKWKERYGFKIVVDLDDYWELHPSHPFYQQSLHMPFTIDTKTALLNADAIFTTTSRLATKVIQYITSVGQTKMSVHVVPNGLPFDDSQFFPSHFESDHIRFIFAGGGSHFNDVRLLTNAMKSIANRTNAEYILAGYDGSHEWDKIERAFNPNKVLKIYTRRNILPLEEYMDHYTYADVSLAPLDNLTFNWYKSNLKVLEAGCKYMPIITSDVSPYKDEPNQDVISYCRGTKDWVKYLQKYEKNPTFVREQGQQLGEYVRANYHLDKMNRLRLQIFEHLIN